MSRKPDPRVNRTRDSLGDALIALILEKPFDEMSVQHVLDRAGISRSTFYAHYRDKEDLLLSDVDDFWSSMSTILSRRGDRSDRVAPVRELFEHVSQSRDLVKALRESGRLHEMFELGRLHFARGIAERLPAGVRDREACAHALAGGLFSLLEWWLDCGKLTTAEDMENLFHRMVRSGLGG